MIFKRENGKSDKSYFETMVLTVRISSIGNICPTWKMLALLKESSCNDQASSKNCCFHVQL